LLHVSSHSTMAAALKTSKNKEDESPSCTIDLGESQQKMVRALIEARSTKRGAKSQSESESLFTRASLLFSRTGKSTDLASIVDRSSNLTALRRTGFVPEDFIQSGPEMTFKRLLKAYALEDLVKFGFTFDHFCQLGFDTDDLKSFTSENYRALSLTAPVILERVPLTGEDLIGFGFEPHLLRELRFTFSHFTNNLKMTSEQLKQLMSERDMKMYFAPSQSELGALQKKNTPNQSRFLQTSKSSALNF